MLSRKSNQNSSLHNKYEDRFVAPQSHTVNSVGNRNRNNEQEKFDFEPEDKTELESWDADDEYL